MDSKPTTRLKVIISGAHPGDPEYACGGTIARYVAGGHEVVCHYLTRGEAGIEGESHDRAAEIRSAEAQAACNLLGARAAFAGQIDGSCKITPELCNAFLSQIAAEKPDIVFAHWPIDNHPDHRVNSLLVYDAWWRTGRSFAIYYYEVSSGEDTLHFAPTHHVDVSAVEPLKKRACYTHASQTPDKFYELQDRISRFRGLESGVTHAEAYIRHVQSRDLILPMASG